MELMEEMWRQADEENETLLITSSDEEEEKEKSNKIEKENDKSEIGLYSLLNSNRATTGTDKGDESENVKKVCESNILGRNVEDRRIIRSDNYQVEKEVRMECEDAIIKPILARYGLIGWKNHQFWTYSWKIPISLVLPLPQVLKTGQGVMEYLKLEGILDQDTIVDIGKNVLQLTKLKISMIWYSACGMSKMNYVNWKVKHMFLSDPGPIIAYPCH